MALWRNTRAPVFCKKWKARHPFETATDQVAVNDTADESKPADDAGKPAADAEPAQPTTVEQMSTKEEVDVEPQPLIVPPEL